MSARVFAPIVVACVALALVAGAAEAQIVRAFAPRFSTNDRGDVLPIGNVTMTCTGGGGCNNGHNGNGGNIDNNDFTMQYVDVDADGTTFSSSRANLAMPAGSTVLWAGLYWGGYSNNGARNQVRFSTPAAGYVTVTASQLDVLGGSNNYQGFAVVTAAVIAGGNGTYTVADVRSTAQANRYGGWSLVVVYRDPLQPSRNLVVFDGFAQVAVGATVTIPVTGFLSPPAGAVSTRLGVVAYEGDLGLTGDQFQLNGVALGDAANPAGNFFNSSIASGGVAVTTKNPNWVNQLGFDIDVLSLTNAIPNGATGATLTLSSAGDQYFPGVVTFATQIYEPIFTAAGFKKTVTDLGGAPTRPTDALEYVVTLTNSGLDGAVQTVLRDTLPANATYVPGSIVVLSGPNAGAKSDAAGDDQAEYEAASRRVVVRLGTGANAVSGGTISPGVVTSARFRVTVGVPAPNGSVVSNRAAFAFQGAQLGNSYTALSDGDSVAAGTQLTSVTVTAPLLSGTVFEDVNYGGGAGRSLAASIGAVRPGARVELYGSTGTFLAADTTDAAGLYGFDGWTPGAYTVRVVESTVTSSRPGALATLRAVPTFRADASSGTAVADPNRVGGETPRLDDAVMNTTSQTLAALTTATATPQAITPVTLGVANLPGVDVGFNFDAVVNVNDAGRGSLRQFLTNANTLGNAGLAQVGLLAGAETAVFMVSDGALHPGLRAGLTNLLTAGVARIVVATALPAVTGASTRLDGAIQTTNIGNTNAGTLGTGGTAGVDALAMPVTQRPEVEIVDGAAIGLGLALQAADLAVFSVSATGFGNTPASDLHANILVASTATNARVERCVLGASATAFADPGAAARSGGDNLRVAGVAGGIARDNLIGFAVGSGVALAAGSDTWLIQSNEIRGNAIAQNLRDGIAIDAGGATIRGNVVATHGGCGIDARGTGGHTLENNTVTRSGRTAGATTETPGIRVGGNGSRIDRNIAFDNDGAGVSVLSGTSANTITRNSIYANGTSSDDGGGAPSGQIGIDLQAAADNAAQGTSPFVTINDAGDGDAGANGLLNFPVLETAALANGSFTLTGWARPGSTIELFIADADPSGFGEGRTYLTTLVEGSGADLDGSSSAYGGLVNGLAQGSDATNRFRFTLATPPGLFSGTPLTATATLTAATSEFSGLAYVVAGVAVSGTAYTDLDHDALRDAGENGTGTTLYAKLVSSSAPLAAQAVAPIDPGTGAYGFTFVASGTYSIVLDDNAVPGDLTPTPPAQWTVTEAAPGVRPNVAVASADVAGQNFGLWHGSRIDGAVFRDDGSGAGTPNDGVRQAGEAGVAGVRVRLMSAACGGGACDSVLSGGGGDYALWLPHTAAGLAVRVMEVNAASWLSTGGSPGTTGGAYTRAADATDFTGVAGTILTGVNFGDVPANLLVPAGANGGPPGGVVFYPHRFTAGSAGDVTFATVQAPSPALPGWGAVLHRDLDCDGVVDAGEPSVGGPIAVTAGQTVCLVLRHTIPAGAPAGATEQATVSASFSYVGAVPALNAAASTQDLTTVIDAGGLEIVKSVDVATALPGGFMIYTIQYRNLGALPLGSIVIHDATPTFTVLDAVGCGSLGNGLSGCSVTTSPVVGAPGSIEWTLGGTLAPGGSGTVTFRVRVQ